MRALSLLVAGAIVFVAVLHGTLYSSLPLTGAFPDPISNETEAAAGSACSDSDGGLAFSFAGTCSGATTKSDFCLDQITLIEYVCAPDVCAGKKVDCPTFGYPVCIAGACTNSSHLVCLGFACSLVSGPGPNSCLTDPDCVLQSHLGCVQNTCALLPGLGVNTCLTPGASCSASSGPGSGSSNPSPGCAGPDCQIALTHLACVNEACTFVSGSGPDQCTLNAQCQNQTNQTASDQSDLFPGVSGIGYLDSHTITVLIKVQNIGGVLANASTTTVVVSGNGTFTAQLPTPSLAAGEYVYVKANFTVSPGNWSVTATADTGNAVNESSETNNINTIQFLFPVLHLACISNACAIVAGSGPDECSSTGSVCDMPQNQTATCVDTDFGQDPFALGDVVGNAPNGTFYGFTDACLSNETLLEYYCTDTAAGQEAFSAQVPCAYGCSEGVCLAGEALADLMPGVLVPSFVNFTNTSWTIQLSLNVTNNGTITAGPSTVRFNLTQLQTNNTIVKFVPIPAILPGQNSTAITIVSVKGFWSVEMTADAFNAVPETKENNNIFTSFLFAP